MKSRTQCFQIFPAPYRWIHLVICIIPRNVFFTQGKVMRAYFRGHFQSFIFGFPYHSHTVCGRAVAQMKSGTSLLCQKNISRRNHILNGIWDTFLSHVRTFLSCVHGSTLDQCNILTVCKYRNTEFRCLAHGFAVYLCIHDGLSVLTDGTDACLLHRCNICYLCSCLSLCYCPDRKHI